ncbi:MAG TPA: DUF6438 domain-containing protein [Flavipsychrobacter sp.]|nr:DUF6438 domain-containing protein [Flavipsychrobacter sp.]
MRKILSLLSVVVLMLTACAAQKKVSTPANVSYVQMWRTSCFGKCPDYRIELYSDGLMRYTGRIFTDTGIYEKNIGAAQAKELLRSFTEKRVDTLKNQYEVHITDLPGINYTFKYGSTVKEVRNAEYGPHYLREVANRLDKFVKKEEGDIPKMDGTWKKISDYPKGD